MLSTSLSIVWLSLLFHLGMISLAFPPDEPRQGESFGLVSPHFGRTRFAPTLGVGIPRGAVLGAQVRLGRYAGMGATYAMIPEQNIRSTRAALNSLELAPRVYPYGQAFFLGFAVGQQELHASRKESIEGYPLQIEGSVRTVYVEPQIGWHWERASGFFWGLELGWQIGLAARTETATKNVPAALESFPQYQEVRRQVESLGNDLGRTSLPVATLKIGWYF